MENFKSFKKKIQFYENIRKEPEISADIKTLDKHLSNLLYMQLAVVLESMSENMIKTAVSKIPDVRDTLEDYRIYLDGKKYTINWDGETLTVHDENEEKIFEDEISDMEKVKAKLIELFVSLPNEPENEATFGQTEPEDELTLDTMIDTEQDPVKKKKLIHLKKYIIPEFINVYLTNSEQKKELVQVLLKHLNDEKVPVSLKSEIKSSIVKLFFNIIDIILDDRNTANLFATNSANSVIYEAKKTKSTSVVDRVSKKLEYLLRIGLTDKRFIHRVKKALTMNKVSAASIKVYRDIIFDLISQVLEYIENDAVLYNKLRMILTKKNALIKETDLGYVSKLVNQEILNENTWKKKVQALESAPPNFPEKLEKKLLKYYKGNEEIAYATMWKIHNMKKKNNKNRRRKNG